MCLSLFTPPRLSLVLTFIAAAIMLAAAVTLTNFAQAEVTGKAVPPSDGGTCPLATGLGIAVGVGAWNVAAPRPTVLCIERAAEYNAGIINLQQPYTLTANTTEYVVEGRLVNGSRELGILRTVGVSETTPPNPAPDPNPTNPPDNGNNTPTATVQAKSSNDAKRLAQYGAAGFAAVVLIHNYWFAAPGAALPFHLAFNEKGAIYSGTSFRLSPRETLHLSALESLDDKRGEYKFGVQWHYQFAPPRGTTKTPPAAPPAVYTMPNVKPKDWLKK